LRWYADALNAACERDIATAKMWGAAPRAALPQALPLRDQGGCRLKHDVDISMGLVNPVDWLNVLVLLRSHNYSGPFGLDYKPPHHQPVRRVRS
jgi:hypothetical protein